jgi:hypothetical protein
MMYIAEEGSPIQGLKNYTRSIVVVLVCVTPINEEEVFRNKSAVRRSFLSAVCCEVHLVLLWRGWKRFCSSRYDGRSKFSWGEEM